MPVRALVLWQVAEDNTICGVVTEGNLTAKLMSGRVKPSDPVTAALYPQFRKVAMDTSLGDLARMFDKDHFAIVVTTQRCYAGAGLPVSEKSVVAGVVSRYGGVGGGAAAWRGGLTDKGDGPSIVERCVYPCCVVVSRLCCAW